jgi:hypothetical protein
MSTLSNGTVSVDFSDDLTWTDEYEWHPVNQTAQRTITGALIVSSSTLTGGRPITLEPDEQGPWHSRDQVDALRNLAAAPGQVLTLTLRGQNYTVIFRHQDTGAAAVDAKQIIPFAAPIGTDFYKVTLRLMEL